MGTTPNLPTLRTRRTIPAGLGDELRSARRAANRSRSDVAAEVGVSRWYVGALERAERAPSQLVAAALIYALRLRPDVADALWGVAVDDAGRSLP